MGRSASKRERSRWSSVRQFFSFWWRQPGVRLQLLFIGMLVYLVSRNGMMRLAVTLLVALPLAAAFAGWKWRKHGAEMFEQ